jgi:outer membrane protein assembly factor BamB
LLVGCGSHSEAVTPVTQTRTVRHVDPVPTRPTRPSTVLVTVVDGDTNTPVHGARVTIGRRSAHSDRNGVARLRLPARRALLTAAVKRGYDERVVRFPFRARPKATIRIYRPALQWTMYGADARRTQTQPDLRVRPPFRVVWSRGLGSLIEFPAVVKNGVAYIANAEGTVTALDMRTGAVVWKHETPNGKMASSPAVWGDQLVVHGMDGHIWILRRTDGRVLWDYTVGSPVESSPIVVGGVDVFGAWNGTITALDLRTHHVRWRKYDGCKITSSAALAGSTLYIGDYCGRLLALRASNGIVRWSQSVNGRIYGTPAVAAGRVFVPSSDGGSLTAFTTSGRYLWAHGTGGPISGAATVVDGVAYAGSFAHRILGVDVRSGRVVLDFPHGEYAPVSGAGRRLLLHGYSRVYAVVRK